MKDTSHLRTSSFSSLPETPIHKALRDAFRASSQGGASSDQTPNDGELTPVGDTMLRRSREWVRWSLRSTLGRYPLYLSIVRYRHPEKVVDEESELLIEGFPRSANTFAEMAFRMAQPTPVKIAHHLHIPVQVMDAVERGIPALVLVRPPVDAAASLIIKTVGLTPRLVLRYYVRFYRALLPYRHRVVTASFDEVTSNFGAVTQRLNAHYGTRFTPFEHTDANVERCFALIENRFARPSGEVCEGTVGRPSSARAPLKNRLTKALQAPSLAPLRSEAQALYVAFTAPGKVL